MAKTFYHNITKMKLNENDFSEIYYTNGDVVFKTEAGSAILIYVFPDELKQLVKSTDDETATNQ